MLFERKNMDLEGCEVSVKFYGMSNNQWNVLSSISYDRIGLMGIANYHGNDLVKVLYKGMYTMNVVASYDKSQRIASVVFQSFDAEERLVLNEILSSVGAVELALLKCGFTAKDMCDVTHVLNGYGVYAMDIRQKSDVLSYLSNCPSLKSSEGYDVFVIGSNSAGVICDGNILAFNSLSAMQDFIQRFVAYADCFTLLTSVSTYYCLEELYDVVKEQGHLVR